MTKKGPPKTLKDPKRGPKAAKRDKSGAKMKSKIRRVTMHVVTLRILCLSGLDFGPKWDLDCDQIVSNWVPIMLCYVMLCNVMLPIIMTEA